MAINLPGYRATPPLSHRDIKGKECHGSFVFDFFGSEHTLNAFSERSCAGCRHGGRFYAGCGRRETYEIDQVILVAELGTTVTALEECAMAILKRAHAKDKVREINTTSHFRLIRDVSDHERLAVIITVPGIGFSDVEKQIDELLQQIKSPVRFSDIWRKPAAYDGNGNKIPY